MSVKFSDRVFGSNVNQSIIDIFDNLQKGSLDIEPLGEAKPEFQDYLGERSPFARMWSATLVSGSERKEIIYNIVNDNRDESYVEANQAIGDAVRPELSNNSLLKPKAGITSITSKTEGSLGAIKRTTVEFVVHNKYDFDNIFLPFFLKPGSTVIVDYGWSDKKVNLYEIEKSVSNTDLELSQLKKIIYGGLNVGPNGEKIEQNSSGQYFYKPNPDASVIVNDLKSTKKAVGFINDHFGLVDTMIGRVVSYNASVDSKGSFQCSVELVSENTTLLDSEITEDNSLKFIFENQIEEILVRTITGVEDLTSFKAYDTLSAERKKEALEDFYNELKVSNDEYGIISSKALKTGLYYQNVTDVGIGGANSRDLLYISYGLFEDLFLNGLIATNKIEDDTHSVTYNTKETFVRYDDFLVKRQKEVSLGSNESLPLFLYPDKWGTDPIDNNYNKNTEESFKEQMNGKLEPYKTPVIPFRDLFISVSLLSNTFASKQNVNDALEFLIESINIDSYGVFKLKMISLNKSYSSISFQDANLIPVPEEDPKKMLMFDITSEKSIIIDADYKFGMPKGGLGSLIAIGEKGDYEFFDDVNIDNLNFLNILGPEKAVFGENTFFKSLPLVKDEQKDLEKRKTWFDFSLDKITQVTKQMNIDSKIGQTWEDKVTLLVKDQKKTNKGKSFNPGYHEDSFLKGIKDDEGNILPATSVRDYYGKQAKINTLLASDAISVSPFLPVELSLTIYGNTYLNIGDFFTINFLPDFYLDKIMFQIVNIDQKISSNWVTTYSTVMRLRSNKKGIIVDPKQKTPRLTKTVTQRFFNMFENNCLRNSVPVKINLNTMLVRKASVRYSKEIVKLDAALDVDSRLFTTSFKSPQSFEDVAFIFAFQNTIGNFIRWRSYYGKNITFHATKQLELGIDSEVLNKKIDDVFITALIEEITELDMADGALRFFSNMMGGYNFWTTKIGDLLAKNTEKDIIYNMIANIAKDREMKLFYEGNLPQKTWPGFKGSFEHGDIMTSTYPYSGGKIGHATAGRNFEWGNISDKYGIVMSSIGFMITKDIFEGEQNVFGIKMNRTGLTDPPVLIIPEWFLGLKSPGLKTYSIAEFCTYLDNNYIRMYNILNSTIENLRELKIKKDKASEKSIAAVSEYGLFISGLSGYE